MNAVNDNRELTDAELDFVAGGAPPPHYEFGSTYGLQDLVEDMIFSGPPYVPSR